MKRIIPPAKGVFFLWNFLNLSGLSRTNLNKLILWKFININKFKIKKIIKVSKKCIAFYSLVFFVIIATLEQNKNKSIPNTPKEVSNADLKKRQIIIIHDTNI